MRRRRPLSLQKYNCFFVDPWDTVISISNLNDVRTWVSSSSQTSSVLTCMFELDLFLVSYATQILDMHGFIRLHREPKVISTNEPAPKASPIKTSLFLRCFFFPSPFPSAVVTGMELSLRGGPSSRAGSCGTWWGR
jgi:hypothetical protein